jgi:hypothetical protein
LSASQSTNHGNQAAAACPSNDASSDTIGTFDRAWGYFTSREERGVSDQFAVDPS